MRSFRIILTVLVLVVMLQSASAEVIYQELFTGTTVGVSEPWANVGWVGYENTTASGWSYNCAPGSAVVEDGGSINSNPIAPDATTHYSYGYGHIDKASFQFTEEYSFSLDTMSELQFSARTNHSSGGLSHLGENIRAAVRVGSDWYVSDTDFTIKEGGWSLTNPDATWNIDADSVNWYSLTFDPGVAMGVGSQVALPTTGTVTAFGFYADAQAYNRAIRMDNYKISAVPEPATIALLAMGMLAVLKRRK